jgi:hypothetical protein
MHKLSYLGGLIDGEGCFTLCKARNKAVTPVFSLASTSDVIITFIVNCFKEYEIVFSLTETDRKDNSKPYKTIRVQGNTNIIPLLNLVEEYILEKKPQLLLLKEFVGIRSKYAKNNMKWEETDGVVSNIRKLNYRGRVR